MEDLNIVELLESLEKGYLFLPYQITHNSHHCMVGLSETLETIIHQGQNTSGLIPSLTDMY